MNIILNKKNTNKKNSAVEIIILNKTKDLTQKEQELLNNINFYEKSFNTHFDIKNSKLYVSCLKLKDENIKTAICTAINFLKKTKIQNIKIDIIQSKKELEIQTIVEGLVLGNYEFLKYKSTSTEEKIKDVEICINSSSKTKEELDKDLKKALIICNSVNFTKDIVNSSPEDYYP